MPFRPSIPRRAGAALATLLLAAVPALAAEPHGAVLKRIPIGGDGGWDYLFMDDAAHRLYVSHGTRVVVLDTRTDSLVGEVAPAPGVHGVAVAPELGRGFTSNGRDSSVTVFDTRTLAVTGRIAIPARNPDAIVYDPATKRVFTFNGGSGNAAVIDAVADTVVTTVALGGRPEFAAVDGAGRLWANLEDSSAVVLLDTHTLKLLARWPLAPGEGPSGLALDRAHRRLFSVCGNRTMVVLDAANGRVVATLPIGAGVDAVAYDATRGLVLASNGEGTLTVVRQDGPDRYAVLETVPTERGARTLALDGDSGRVYLSSAEFGPPPAPTPDRPHPRPSIVPGTFRLLVVQP